MKQLLTALVIVLLMTGCCAKRPSGVAEFYSGNWEKAREIYNENLKAEPNSAALYHLRLGTLDLGVGNDDAAKEHFIRAASTMQDFTADGEFRAVVGREETKEYKGDPYEQMMGAWYLGGSCSHQGSWPS